MYSTAEPVTICCPCGAKAELHNLGGSYQEFYAGQCARCGKRWTLVYLDPLHLETEEWLAEDDVELE